MGDALQDGRQAAICSVRFHREESSQGHKQQEYSQREAHRRPFEAYGVRNFPMGQCYTLISEVFSPTKFN
jgi:hypothetical protein